ncbi:hypothetical protein G3N57_01120 [Paraburkholderia sp. Se-20369]|nr:hypothetical protein [Paraburkholderia sp. Se-20369]
MDPVTSTITFLVIGDNTLSASNAGLKEGATLVSSSGQIVGLIGSVNPAGTIATNPAAAMVTALKISVDYQAGKPIQPGDILAVMGNLVATAGAVACYIPGGQVVGVGAIIVGDLLNIGGLYLDRNQIGDAFKSVYDAVAQNGSVPVNSPDGATLQSFVADHNGRDSGGATVAATFNTDDTVGKITSYDKSGNIIQTDSYTYTKDGTGKIAAVTENLYNAGGTLLSSTVTNADNSSATTVYNSPADSHLITVTNKDANGKITQVATTVADTSANTYDTTVTDASGKVLYTQISTYVDGMLSTQAEYDPLGALTRQTTFWSGKLILIDSYSSGTLVGRLEYRYDDNGNFIDINASGASSITGSNLQITLDRYNIMHFSPAANLTLVGTGNTVTATWLNEPYHGYDSVFNLVAGDSVTIIDSGGITINGGAGEAITLTSIGDTVNVSGDSANLVAADGQTAGITLTQGSAATFSGSGNTIRAAANATVNNATGDDIVLTGNGVIVQGGNGNRIVAADGARVNIRETNDTITGNNEVIDFEGSLTLKGTGDVVTGGGTLTLIDNTSVTFNGVGTIKAGADDAITIDGERSVVTINVNGDAAGGKTTDGKATGIVLGRNVKATIIGAGNAITAAGSDNLTASHDDITLNGSNVTITGEGNHITAIANATMTLSGVNLDETIVGNGETIKAFGQGSLTLRGTGDIVTANRTTLTLANSGSSLTLGGGDDTIVSGGGDTITITSAQDGTPQDKYTLKVSGSDSVVLGKNVRLSIDGSGNAITAAGNDDITGSGNKITLTGDGTWITGDNNAIMASGRTVGVENSNNNTLFGDNNTIEGGVSTLRLEGTGNTVASGAIAVTLVAGASVTVSGGGDTVYAGSDNAVTINASTNRFDTSTNYVEVSNNTAGIVVNQGGRVSIKGTGNRITTHGAYDVGADGSTITLDGSGTNVSGDNNVLHAADNLTLYVYGTNNVVFGNNETINSYVGSLTLEGTGDSVTTSGSTLRANGIGVTLTGTNDTLVGDNDVLTLGGGTMNLTVQGADETIVLSDPTITAASLKVSASANGKDLLLTDSATGNQRIVFDGMLAAGNQGATQLKFADGTVWTRAQMLSMAHAAGTPSVPPPPVGMPGTHATDVQVNQLIHAMAAFSPNRSNADWISSASPVTADTAVLAQGHYASHLHRP